MKIARTMMTSSAIVLLDHGIKVAAIFLVTPWMARGLGPERYGLWLLAMSLIGYLALIDFGVTLAGARYISRYLGVQDGRKLANTVAALRHIYRKLGLACVLGTIVLTVGSFWCFRDSVWRNDLSSIVLVLGFGLSLRLWFRLSAAVLRGHLVYGKMVWASIVRTIMQAGGAWLVLQMGANFQLLTLVYLVGDVLELVWLNLAARHLKPTVRVIEESEKEERSEILRYALHSLSGAVAQMLRGQIPPLSIVWGIGVGALPVYSIAMRLVGVVEDSLGALFGGQWLSAFSRMEGDPKANQQRQVWIQRLSRYAASLAVTAICGLLILGKPFLHLWLGPDFVESHELLCILSVPAMLHLAQWPARALVASSPFYGSFTKWSFFAAMIVAIGSFIVVPWFGVRGIVYLLSFHHVILFGGFLTHYVCRITGMNPLEYWGPALKASLALGAFSLAYAQLVPSLLVPDFKLLFLAGLGLGVGCTIIVAIFGLNPFERRAITSLIKARFA